MSSSILLYQVIVEYVRKNSKRLKNIKTKDRAEKALVAEKSRDCTSGCRSPGVH